MSEKYYYAVARTAELENRLLDRARIQQLVSAVDAQSALRLLSGTPYGDAADKLADPGDFDKILKEQTKQLFDYIDEVSPKKELSMLFLVAYDVFNLKVFIRSQLLGRDFSHLQYDLGIHSAEMLKNAVENEEYEGLMPELANALRFLRESGERSPQVVDTVLDKAQFAAQLRLAEKIGSKFVLKSVQMNIDLINIKDFCRTKAGQKAAFSPVFIEGGSLGMDFFYGSESSTEADKGLAEKLAQTEYASLVKGIEEFESTESMALLEKLCDDALTAFYNSAVVTFGPEKLLGYIAAKTGEIAALRMIMISKINGIPASVIRQRLRDPA